MKCGENNNSQQPTRRRLSREEQGKLQRCMKANERNHVNYGETCKSTQTKNRKQAGTNSPKHTNPTNNLNPSTSYGNRNSKKQKPTPAAKTNNKTQTTTNNKTSKTVQKLTISQLPFFDSDDLLAALVFAKGARTVGRLSDQLVHVGLALHLRELQKTTENTQ